MRIPVVFLSAAAYELEFLGEDDHLGVFMARGPHPGVEPGPDGKVDVGSAQQTELSRRQFECGGGSARCEKHVDLDVFAAQCARQIGDGENRSHDPGSSVRGIRGLRTAAPECPNEQNADHDSARELRIAVQAWPVAFRLRCSRSGKGVSSPSMIEASSSSARQCASRQETSNSSSRCSAASFTAISRAIAPVR